MDEKTYFDKLVERKKDRSEYEGIYLVYQNIADEFKQNTLDNNFGEYYYLCKKIEFKTLDPLPKITSFLSWASCGYGERPFNALIMGIVLILIFAFLYLFIGLDIDNHFVIYNLQTLKQFDLIKFIEDYNESLALSSGIFLGVGGYSCEPVRLSLVLSNIEMILGVITVGVGTGAIVRKLIR